MHCRLHSYIMMNANEVQRLHKYCSTRVLFKINRRFHAFCLAGKHNLYEFASCRKTHNNIQGLLLKVIWLQFLIMWAENERERETTQYKFIIQKSLKGKRKYNWGGNGLCHFINNPFAITAHHFLRIAAFALPLEELCTADSCSNIIMAEMTDGHWWG